MDWKQYISVMAPMTQAGTLTFQIDTFDAAPNVSFTFTATGGPTLTEVQLAQSIQNEFNFALANNFVTIVDTANPLSVETIPLSWNGMPGFSNDPIPPLFYIGRSDNIVSVWSQTQFDILIVTNTTGAQINIGPSPTFVCLAEANLLAGVMGVDFEDNNENALTNPQLCKLLEIASDQIVRLINNPIVIANQLQDFIGNKTGTVRLKARPCLDYDIPQTRRPYIIGITSVLITKSPVAYQLDRRGGWLNYRFTNDLIEISEPFDQYNEIKITWRAGYLNIPSIIKEKTIQAAQNILIDINVKSLRGGSGSVEYFRPLDTLKWLMVELREYRLDA